MTISNVPRESAVSVHGLGTQCEKRLWLHEVILPVFVTILVAGCCHAFLIIQEIIGVCLLVLQLFPLLLQPGLFLLL